MIAAILRACSRVGDHFIGQRGNPGIQITAFNMD
jgi:hypothetical protein